MATRNLKKEICFFQLFDRFIQESKSGKRLQPNGKKLKPGTVKNYIFSRQLLERFCHHSKFDLRIRQDQYLNKRDREIEKNYWKKFYRLYMDYLYGKCGYFDNYVGQNVKILKTFFNYLNVELGLGVGLYYKQFHVRKEEIMIFPLMPEELSFLIYNREFEALLSARMKQTKDFFVFGCTVALRVSDLFRLKWSDVRIVQDQYFLSIRSLKTNVDTLIKLPDYAIAIIKKYKKRQKGLLPSFSLSSINDGIKQLLEAAGFVQEVHIYRSQRGRTKPLFSSRKDRKFRFCDVASSHTMRRTAITTMLSLGMPEQLVRKISGHTPASKEFFRYVIWAQAYQDQESVKVFDLLKEKSTMAHTGIC